ncbi:hypothetical protein RGQ29_015776 [Quercus rubra]|uniref:Protein UXT homolog n=1 Tax=Quercus rubra TaxID=3512 RepID=A0AAN7J3X0_QUERU|nr:hypothetical protein RGQ29_015776 [Quercus rubra]
MDRFRQEKLQRYEEFVDKRLKPDLVHAIAERDKVFEQQKTFSDLRKNIENLEKNTVTSLRTLVNLGSEVYMQADVPDTQRIFVDIGLGFHVEFTWSEALNFISQREERLARQIEEYTRLIASIKAQIYVFFIFAFFLLLIILEELECCLWIFLSVLKPGHFSSVFLLFPINYK